MVALLTPGGLCGATNVRGILSRRGEYPMLHTICMTYPVPKDDPMFAILQHRAQTNTSDSTSFYLLKPNCIDEYGEVIQFCFRMVVDCLAMFRVQNISIAEVPRIIPAIDSFLAPTGLTADDFNLTRIDYSFSAKEPSPIVRNCIFQMLQKCPGYGEYTALETRYYSSVRRESGSKVIQSYDKNTERNAKVKWPRDYERDVIRTEVQILREHLKSQKRSKGTPRKLKDWLDWDKYRKYMGQAYFFLFEGDFYDLPAAIAKIAASVNTEGMKKKLITFITTIADHDVDTAKAAMNVKTYKGYVERLTTLNINPITIPEKYHIHHISTPFELF